MFQTKDADTIRTRLLRSVIFPDIRAAYEIISCSQRGHKWQYNAAQKTHDLYPR
jgi:hypothetical protein